MSNPTLETLPYRGRLAISGIARTALFSVLIFLPNLPMYRDSLVEYSRCASADQATRLAR